MFLSKKAKLLFFHIPKTAGISIRRFLDNTCSDSRYFTSYSFESYIKLHSYKYKNYSTSLHGPKLTYPPGNQDFHHLTQVESKEILKQFNIDFDDYTEFTVVRNPYDRVLSFYNAILHMKYKSIENLFDDAEMNKIHPSLHFKSQLEYVQNPICKNHKIFKHEELHKCEEFLQAHLSTNDKLIKSNITKNSLINTLNDSQRERCYRLFEEEFNILGYEK